MRVMGKDVSGFAKRVIHQALGISIGQKPELGRDLYTDIRVHLPKEWIGVYFDVGANVGQTVIKIRATYPSSQIFAFEPDPATFQLLVENVKGIGRVKPFNIGLSSKAGISYLSEDPASEMRQVSTVETSMQIMLNSLDRFCTDQSVKTIDLLKIDTEGHELDVLRGATKMLRESRIRIVTAECTLNPNNQHHAPFFDLHEFLCGFGYMPFAIYEQVCEWPTEQPILRRIDAAYIAPSTIQRNTGQR